MSKFEVGFSSGSQLWDAACQRKFIEKVRQAIADYRQGDISPREAIENIAYEFEDQIGDLTPPEAPRALRAV